MAEATFGGGGFWGVESAFRQVHGSRRYRGGGRLHGRHAGQPYLPERVHRPHRPR